MKCFIAVVFAFLPFCLFSSTINTICNGEWSSIDIWDNKVLPQSGDTIIIKHLIKNSDSLEFHNNFICITSIGELCGNQHLFIPVGTKLYNYGNLGVKGITLFDTLVNYGQIKTRFLFVSGLLLFKGGEIRVFPDFYCFEKPTCTPAILNTSNDSLYSNTEAFEFEWYLNDTIILGETTIKIPFFHYGNYKVRSIDTIGNYSEFSDVYLLRSTSAESCQIQDEMVNIYPNPSSGIFNISVFQETLISVKNIFGQIIFNETIYNATQIDLESFGNGVFLLDAKQNNNYFRKKLVLQ